MVAWVAHEELGERAVALTADSQTFPAEERAIALAITTELGMNHVFLKSQELESDGYAANTGDRCYFCKNELFDLAADKAQELGLNWVMDGTVLDDLGDDRPGLVAASRHGVRHPLVEAGFDKAAVRETARSLGVPVWDKPSFACLGSRFPVGTRVTAERVEMVGRVESLLRVFGLRQFRVRFHLVEDQPMARIELDSSELEVLVREGIRDALVELTRQVGFRWVTLDLEGYRTGGAR